MSKPSVEYIIGGNDVSAVQSWNEVLTCTTNCAAVDSENGVLWVKLLSAKAANIKKTVTLTTTYRMFEKTGISS